MRLDWLCDGATNEDNIVPVDDLEISLPDLDAGGCAAGEIYRGVDAVPTIRAANASISTLNVNGVFDLDGFGPIDQGLMVYVWLYIENVTNESREAVMAVAHDNSIHVEVNREEVFVKDWQWGCNQEFSVHHSFPIELKPGRNLVQLKVFQGGGDFCSRLALRSGGPGGCEASGDPGTDDFEYHLDPGSNLFDIPTFPTRAIEGGEIEGIGEGEDTFIEAMVTVVPNRGAETYTLIETFDPEWNVTNVTGGGVMSPEGDSITWADSTLDSVEYNLRRTDPEVCNAPAGTIQGTFSSGEFTQGVRGDNRMIGCVVAPFVENLLLTPPYEMGGGEHIQPSVEQLRGDWLAGTLDGGGGFTDRTLVPTEGLVFAPDFSNLVTLGMADWISCPAKEKFWEFGLDPENPVCVPRENPDDPPDPDDDPPSPSDADSKLVRVEPTSSTGLYDFNALGIYQTGFRDDAPNDPKLEFALMNVAFFYVINESSEERCVRMGVGSSDSVSVRVNGWPSWVIPFDRGHEQFTDKFQVKLDPGKNLISIYTFRHQASYGLCVRFENEKGVAMYVPTTLDPTGYDPDAHAPPAGACISGQETGFTELGFVTKMLVIADPMTHGVGGDPDITEAEAFLGIDRDNPMAPSVDNVRPGVTVVPGVEVADDDAITNDFKNNSIDETQLVIWNGIEDGDPADPGLFDTDFFYFGGVPNAGILRDSTTAFFFLLNKTSNPVEAFFGLDGAPQVVLFVNNERIAEYTRDLFGQRSEINTFEKGPFLAVLEPGLNLVQVSHLGFGNLSGFRVAVSPDCSVSSPFDSGEVQLCLDPDAPGGCSGADFVPPDIPSGLVATGDRGVVNLDFAFFEVLRSESSGIDFESIGQTATSAFEDTTAVIGTPYFYMVTATDTSDNTSSPSDEASAAATPFTGACCLGDGSCAEFTEAECNEQSGTYEGDATACQDEGIICGVTFRRGDHDSSGSVDITDSLNRLGFLFLGTTPSDCQDASDFDNSGAVDISDSLNELTFLFLGLVTPPPPGVSDCGLDPSEVVPEGGGLPEQPVISLGCESYAAPCD
jgi:hypothetical protein